MRALKLDLSVPLSVAIPVSKGELLGRVRVTPADLNLCAVSVRNILTPNNGLIVPVWFDISANDKDTDRLALRRLNVSLDGQVRTFLEFEDEIGDSIARHVWDSGLVTISMLSDMCAKASRGSKLPMLRESLLREGKLRILELGCGIGTLGIGLATILHSCGGERPVDASILLTDLPDAEDRAVANITRFRESATNRKDIQLDYDNLDWEDGRKGIFPPKVESAPWDLVILSDCTYNVDTLPALVQTLSALDAIGGGHGIEQDTHPGLKVLVATKERHSSERAFFKMMSKAGWSVLERLILPLPVLAASSESIEVYLFGRDACSDVEQT